MAGFKIDHHAGLLTSLGMALHAIPEGALAASLAIAGGFKKSTSQILVVLVGVALLVGALAGAGLSHLFDFSTTLLPLASGALLYISMAHFLPLTLRIKNGHIGLMAGLLLVFLLSMGHHHHH